ncbi:unnamed protein product, partial [Ectocarpus sp. 12 AP-2014]
MHIYTIFFSSDVGYGKRNRLLRVTLIELRFWTYLRQLRQHRGPRKNGGDVESGSIPGFPLYRQDSGRWESAINEALQTQNNREEIKFELLLSVLRQEYGYPNDYGGSCHYV